LYFAPDGIKQHITGKNLPTMTGQVIDKPEFQCCGGNFVPSNRQFHRGFVDDNFARLGDGNWSWGGCSPQNSSDAGREFTGSERFA